MKVTIKSKASDAKVVSFGGHDYVIKAGSQELEPVAGHSAKAVAQAAVKQLTPAVCSFTVKADEGEDTEDALLIEHVEKMQAQVLQPLRKPSDTEHYSEKQLKDAQVQWAKEEKSRSLGRSAEHVNMKAKELRQAGAPEVKTSHVASPVRSAETVTHEAPKAAKVAPAEAVARRKAKDKK